MLASFHKFRGLAILLALSTCLGCLPMGLPEHFQGGGDLRPTLAHSSRVLVVFDPSTVSDAKRETESLGSQFVLGLVPVTRIFFEHGSNSLLRELTLEILTQEDVLVGETSLQNLATAARNFKPDLILQPQLNGLSSNAFDLFLARKVSVSGELTLDVLSDTAAETKPPTLLRRNSAPISFSEFRTAAQAPVVAYAIEKSLDNALRPLLQDELGRLRQFPRQSLTASSEPQMNCDQAQRLLTIEPTILNETAKTQVAAELGRALSRSYGFDSVPDFSPGVVSRLINRGFEAGALSLGLPSLLVNSSVERTGNTGPQWFVRPTVTNIELVGDGTSKLATVDITVEIREAIAGFGTGRDVCSGSAVVLTPVVLKRLACHSQVAVDTRHDGALVVAFSKAASEVAKAILEKSELAACHDLD